MLYQTNTPQPYNFYLNHFCPNHFCRCITFTKTAFAVESLEVIVESCQTSFLDFYLDKKKKDKRKKRIISSRSEGTLSVACHHYYHLKFSAKNFTGPSCGLFEGLRRFQKHPFLAKHFLCVSGSMGGFQRNILRGVMAIRKTYSDGSCGKHFIAPLFSFYITDDENLYRLQLRSMILN